jgi:mycofactocin precursor
MTAQTASKIAPAQRPVRASEPTGPAADEVRAGAPDIAEEPVVEELLVEEVSIDGMCGVY